MIDYDGIPSPAYIYYEFSGGITAYVNNKMTDEQYRLVEKRAVSNTPIDDEFIRSCEDTIEMYAICEFLTSYKNTPRLERYHQRMQNVQFILNKVNRKDMTINLISSS